jgi:hypothetical protein
MLTTEALAADIEEEEKKAAGRLREAAAWAGCRTPP